MKKVIFLAIITFITIPSCISVRFTNIDIQNPAQVTFPKEVVNLAIVNNLPILPDNKETSEDSDVLSIDSICNSFIDSLAYYLDKQNFYGQVLTYPGFTRTDNNAAIIKALSKEQVRSISKEMNIDALISVDMFQIQGSLSDVPGYYTNSFKELAMDAQIILRSYTANGEEFQTPILFNDTLFWEGIPIFNRKEYALPTIEDACTDMISYAINKLIKAYVPSWSTEERVYFANGSALMKKATKYVNENKWQEAISTWETAYKNEKSESKKVRIAYNLAVGYETIDNINKAITWIRSAKQNEANTQHSQIKEQVDWYYKELQKREIQSKMVKKQLGITEADTP